MIRPCLRRATWALAAVATASALPGCSESNGPPPDETVKTSRPAMVKPEEVGKRGAPAAPKAFKTPG